MNLLNLQTPKEPSGYALPLNKNPKKRPYTPKRDTVTPKTFLYSKPAK